VLNKGGVTNFGLKLVAMAMTLDSKKRKSDPRSVIKYLPFGKNFTKIGPVDPEIIGLK